MFLIAEVGVQHMKRRDEWSDRRDAAPVGKVRGGREVCESYIPHSRYRRHSTLRRYLIEELGGCDSACSPHPTGAKEYGDITARMLSQATYGSTARDGHGSGRSST